MLLVETGKKKTFLNRIECDYISTCFRIKFGKPALKCADCRATCHVDCKPRMSTYCVPTAQTAASSNKGFAGTVADYAPASAPMIPALVIHCVDEIERRGMNQVALYRMNASEKEIHDLKVSLQLPIVSF